MKQEGSILIVVIACIALVCLMSVNSIHTAWLCSDIVHKKQRYEQRLQSVQGLVTYALVLTKKLRHTWLENDISEWHKDFASWPCGDGADYSGHIDIQCEPSRIHIVTELHIHGKKVVGVTCDVIAASGNNLVVQGWHLHGA